MTDPVDSRVSARVKLLLIVTIAVVPLVLAYLFNFCFRDFAPAETTNNGHLITPPRHVEDIAMAPGEEIPLGRWAILMVTGSECDKDCQRLLYLSRQVHRALGRDAQRVERFVLVAGNEMSAGFDRLLNSEYPQTRVRYYSPSSLIHVFGGLVEAPVDGDHLFLMDPNGNIMMYYTGELAGKPMLSDLKHLLKVSTIG